MKRVNVYLWVMLSFLAALAIAVIAMPGAGSSRPVAIAAALALSAGVAAFFAVRAFRAARREPALRATWILFSLGALAWFGGEVFDFVRVVNMGVGVPYPSYGDVFWGAGAAFIISTLVIKVVKRPRGASPQAVAGAVATAALTLIVVVNFVIVPAVRNPTVTPAECLADCLIVAADFALGTLALLVIAVYGGQGMARPWVQLAVGIIFYALGDAIRWHLAEAGHHGSAGSLVTALFWAGGYLLIGLGAYYRRLVLKGVIVPPRAEAEVEG
jgi:hypothetical protein